MAFSVLNCGTVGVPVIVGLLEAMVDQSRWVAVGKKGIPKVFDFLILVLLITDLIGQLIACFL